MNTPTIPKKYTAAAHPAPSFETHFNKTFLGKEVAWQEFVDKRFSSPHEIACAVNHKRGERILTDPYAFFAPSIDLHLWEDHLPVPPVVGSDEHKKEVEFVQSLVKTRDVPFAERQAHYEEELPLGLTQVSYFLKDHVQNNFKAGVDYLTTQAEYDHVYAGNKPVKTQEYAGKGPIRTPRDGARFVRDDNPMMLLSSIVLDLIQMGADVRMEYFIRDAEHLVHSFTIAGPIDIGELLWHTGRRVARLSWRTKFLWMYPRPEQACRYTLNEFLPQCFDRGSPMHGSFSAMHAAIWHTLGAIVKKIIDPLFVLPNGNTVGFEIDLLVANASDWRVDAGVHYLMDNRKVIPLSVALAEKILHEKLTQTCMCKA